VMQTIRLGIDEMLAVVDEQSDVRDAPLRDVDEESGSTPAAGKQTKTRRSKPFSKQACAALKKRVSDYAKALLSESRKEAGRRREDTVSEADVESAAQHLVSISNEKVSGLLGTVGGMLLGAVVSKVMMLMPFEQASSMGIVATIVFSIAGASMITWRFAKD